MSQFHSERITDPSIKRFFEGKNFAFVSTLTSNGYPHTTPTWVDLEDGNIRAVIHYYLCSRYRKYCDRKNKAQEYIKGSKIISSSCRP